MFSRSFVFSPVNVALLAINIVLAYWWLSPSLKSNSTVLQGLLTRLMGATQSRCSAGAAGPDKQPALEPLEPRDWTLSELREHDGVRSPRILVAIDWRVFDVSSAAHLYGPGMQNLPSNSC